MLVVFGQDQGRKPARWAVLCAEGAAVKPATCGGACATKLGDCYARRGLLPWGLQRSTSWPCICLSFSLPFLDAASQNLRQTCAAQRLCNCLVRRKGLGPDGA